MCSSGAAQANADLPVTSPWHLGFGLSDQSSVRGFAGGAGVAIG